MPPQVTTLRMEQKFKKTPAGEIPVDWQVNRLGDLCSEKPEYGANVRAIEFQAGLPRYVRITDIESDGTLSSHDWKSIRREEAEPYLLTEGDMIFARSGATVGKTYLYRKSDGPCAFAGYTIRFRTDRGRLLPEYLFQLTHSELYYQWVKGVLRAGAQPNINGSEYSDFVFPVPPLLEQDSIAEVLSAVDDAIEKTAAVIQKTRELKKALLHHLFTRGIGHTEFKRTEIGEIPRGWRPVSLGEGVSLKHGWAFKGECFGGVGPSLVTPGNFSEEGGFHFDPSNHKRYAGRYPKEFEFLPGDLAIVMTDLTPHCRILGAPAVIPATETFLHNQRIGKFIFLGPAIAKEFLYYLCLSIPFRNALRSTATGTTVRHTSPSRILSYRFPLPPFEEQARIAAILGGLEEEIVTGERSRNALDHTKTALMQVLLTGQVRVPL